MMMKITNTNNQKSRGALLRTGKLFLITGLSLMLTVSAFAQDDVNGDPDSTRVPFDGGISLLAAAGVAYGTKRWYDARKNNTGKEADSEA